MGHDGMTRVGTSEAAHCLEADVMRRRQRTSASRLHPSFIVAHRTIESLVHLSTMPAPKLLKKLKQKLPGSKRPRVPSVAGGAPTSPTHPVSPAQGDTAATIDPPLAIHARAAHSHSVTPVQSNSAAIIDPPATAALLTGPSHFVSPGQGDRADTVDPLEESASTTGKSTSRKFFGALKYAVGMLDTIAEDTGVPGLKGAAAAMAKILDDLDVSPFCSDTAKHLTQRISENRRQCSRNPKLDRPS